MYQKHENVLQYRESKLRETKSFYSIGCFVVFYIKIIVIFRWFYFIIFLYHLILGSLCEKQLDFRNRFRLCDTIRADEQIKSMFRLEGKAIDCPLTINNNSPNRSGRNANTAFQLTYRL